MNDKTLTPDDAPEVNPEAQDTSTPETLQAPPAPAPAGGALPDPGAVLSLSDLSAMHINDAPDFDPAIHAVNPDGTPKRRGDGSFAKKRGRKPGQGGALPPKQDGHAVERIDEADEAAKTAANLTIWGGVALFGDEFQPEKDEPKMLHAAYRDYFSARGVKKLPPEVGLAVALSAYILPRIGKPKTRDKLGAVRVKVSGWLSRFKKRKGGAVQPEGAE
jgi:hypothetical protein